MRPLKIEDACIEEENQHQEEDEFIDYTRHNKSKYDEQFNYYFGINSNRYSGKH
tara:strand:+ start:216 stop:377 length:162 start_codon:yes stop_codon:yes gene_type:complete